MDRPSAIMDLLRRAEATSDVAAREQAYEELLRLLTMLVRASMSRKLRNTRESIDVCQSLARSFVQELEGGQIAFETEAALVGYLHKVVRNKLADLSRHDEALRRGGGRSPVGLASDDAGAGVPEDEPGVGSVVAARELEQRLLLKLSDEDRQLINLRRKGVSWENIAAELGSSDSALRKRWSRLQKKLSSEMG